MAVRDPLRYRWTHYGQLIPGTTDATLVLSNVEAGSGVDGGGSYGVRTSNVVGTRSTASHYYLVVKAE